MLAQKLFTDHVLRVTRKKHDFISRIIRFSNENRLQKKTPSPAPPIITPNP